MTEAEREAAGAPLLPEGILPFECWEKLTGESSAAFAAFCVYRDFGAERNIRRAVEAQCGSPGCGAGADGNKAAKRYRVWRGWSTQYRWRERAEAYDRYLDKLKQAEVRKAIEEQGEAQRRIAGKMNLKVEKKVDLMDAADLPVGAVTVWLEASGKVSREAALALLGKDAGEAKTEGKGREIFGPEFEGV
jgi:hypothetical protein